MRGGCEWRATNLFFMFHAVEQGRVEILMPAVSSSGLEIALALDAVARTSSRPRYAGSIMHRLDDSGGWESFAFAVPAPCDIY